MEPFNQNLEALRVPGISTVELETYHAVICVYSWEEKVHVHRNKKLKVTSWRVVYYV